MEFEASEYSGEGVEEFKRFIAEESVRSIYEKSAMCAWGCFDRGKLVGIIAVRQPCHISLMFVDKAYHRRGIAKALFANVGGCFKETCEGQAITVNSSPYAFEVYKKLGFAALSEEKTENGIRFIPMECKDY